jgi:hypothetical protein
MVHRHNVTQHKYRVREQRFRKLTFFIIFIIVLASIIIAIDWFITRISEPTTRSNVSVTSVQSSAINVFRTPYYQFQADDSWVEVAETKSETKYVYRSIKGPLVEHQLTIYVNETAPQDFAATRILPVIVADDGTLKRQADLKKHCNDEVPPSERTGARIVTFLEVTFRCNLESNVYQVFIGEVGGTNAIKATRPNGEMATYTIIYDDLRYTPSPNQIFSTLQTFQIR